MDNTHMGNIPNGTRVILLDIIGTTTPHSFVTETLANYAKGNIYDFIKRFRPLPEIKSNLTDLKRMHTEDIRAGENPPPWDAYDLESDLKCIVEYCIWLIDQDSNAPPLRYIEDFVWEEGYRTGKLMGEVYLDLPDALAKWRSMDIEICTYSSGSVFSQQLIFSTTKYGDLMPFFRGYFDTSVGVKDKAQSYLRIAAILGVEPGEILYFSDSLKELKAAGKAGLNVVLMERDNALGKHEEDIKSMADFSVFTRPGIEP